MVATHVEKKDQQKQHKVYQQPGKHIIAVE